MDTFREVEMLNRAIEGGKILTVPIWKGAYTPAAKFQIVYALGPCLLRVQLLNADEDSWTKEITVESAQWNALLIQAGIRR